MFGNMKMRGREGEAEAARYLRKKGYKLIGQNYSCRYGEIDLIAEKDGFVVFAEVKLRGDDSFAQAREFVTASKQRKLKSAALCWLSFNESERQPRFDVIEIYTSKQGNRINHIENAFE